MVSHIKQKVIYGAQICIGLVLIIVILLQVDRLQFIEYFKSLSLVSLIIILVLSGIGLYIQFRRWKYLVERYSINFNSIDLLPSFFAGFAFRLLIPGGHAEFSKIFLLPGKKRGKVLAFGMEKFAQALIKIFALLIVLPLTFPSYKLYSIFILLLIVIGYFLFPRIPDLLGRNQGSIFRKRMSITIG